MAPQESVRFAKGKKPDNGSTRRFVMDHQKKLELSHTLRAAKNIIHFEAEEEKSESISSLASWMYWLARVIIIIIIIVDALADTWFKSNLATHINVQPAVFFFLVRYDLICGICEDRERGRWNLAEQIQPLKCVLTKAHYRLVVIIRASHTELNVCRFSPFSRWWAADELFPSTWWSAN